MDVLEPTREDRGKTSEPEPVRTVAETAECGCPDWCHRDHGNE